jgi:hypothetical protein
LWKLSAGAASHGHPALAKVSLDLYICCGVSEADAYQWWDDHYMMLINIHTDCCNSKIKMVKQQFNGKFR